jgi:hypothetical protein
MKDRTELGNSERFIIKKVESLYDEWQIFTQFINTENDDLQKNKDSLIQEMHDSDDDELENMEEELVQKMEFLMYGFQIKAKDQKTMLEVLLTYYGLATELGLDEYFSQDLNKVLSELKEQRTKTTFIVANNKVVEREKGAQREAVNKILKSDHYKEYKERLLSTMEK